MGNEYVYMHACARLTCSTARATGIKGVTGGLLSPFLSSSPLTTYIGIPLSPFLDGVRSTRRHVFYLR